MSEGIAAKRQSGEGRGASRRVEGASWTARGGNRGARRAGVAEAARRAVGADAERPGRRLDGSVQREPGPRSRASDFVDPAAGRPQSEAKEGWALRPGLVSRCQIAEMVKNSTFWRLQMCSKHASLTSVLVI